MFKWSIIYVKSLECIPHSHVLKQCCMVTLIQSILSFGVLADINLNRFLAD